MFVGFFGHHTCFFFAFEDTVHEIKSRHLQDDGVIDHGGRQTSGGGKATSTYDIFTYICHHSPSNKTLPADP